MNLKYKGWILKNFKKDERIVNNFEKIKNMEFEFLEKYFAGFYYSVNLK